MKKTKSKEENNKKISNAWRFALLPIATLLYVYGTMSFGAVLAFLIVFVIRRDFGGFQEVTFAHLLIILIGVIIFFPARKFRKKMLDNC